MGFVVHDLSVYAYHFTVAASLSDYSGITGIVRVSFIGYGHLEILCSFTVGYARQLFPKITRCGIFCLRFFVFLGSFGHLVSGDADERRHFEIFCEIFQINLFGPKNFVEFYNTTKNQKFAMHEIGPILFSRGPLHSRCLFSSNLLSIGIQKLFSPSRRNFEVVQIFR